MWDLKPTAHYKLKTKQMKKQKPFGWRCGLVSMAACSLLFVTASAAYGAQPLAHANVAMENGTAAQQTDKTVVKGVVTDKTGQPVIGASVKIVGGSVGAVTDIDGKFAINVKAGTRLQFSCIGYAPKTVVAQAGRTMAVVLDDDSQMLNEVVAIGYGAAAKKKDLSAAVGVVSNVDELAVRPVSSTEGMLQGQLPGVTVQANGGDPTSTPNIVIRGQGSQNGDNVLWVVDGVPGAPISSLNDIESIVVLKDAASAAIYGAQSGAGGVVLVTTKKAKKGEPSLTYDGIYGFRSATNLPTPLNAEQEIEMRKISFANAGQTLPTGWDVNKNPWIATTRTNWMDEIFRTAFYQRHNVALNVGTDKFTNRVSFAYDNDQGVLIDTFNKNLSLHYNGRYELNPWVTISEDFTWKNNYSRGANTENDAFTGPILSAIYMPASATVYSPFTESGFGGTTTQDPEYIKKYGSNYADIHGDAVNPVSTLTQANDWNRSSNTWSTTSLEIANVVPGLKFTSRFTYNMQTYHYKGFNHRRDEVGKPDANNSLGWQTTRGDQWKTENTLTYDNSFGKHTLGALVSTTADHYQLRGLEVNGKTFADESPYLQYLAYAKDVSADDYLTGPDANVSLIGRLAYSYDDRYFVTASWRRDYAGRLPKENNHGDFPAVTGAWKISNENFFPKNSAIDLLKLRASWGRVGNLGSIGMNYKSAQLGRTVWMEQAQYGSSKNTLWNNFVYNASALNPNLTWETSEQFDLGLDLNMFQNRLAMQIDWFEKRTYNLIQTQSMLWPSTIGIDPMLVNMGEVRNRGIEFSATWNEKINKDWQYFVSGNLAWLKNWVSDIGVKDADGNPGVWTNDKQFRILPYMYQTAQGQPLNSFYLVRTAGIFQSDEEAAAYQKDGKRIQPNAKAGDLKFVDFNNDGKIDDADRQYCGAATPKLTFSLSAGFTWKDLSVNAMFQGVGGAQAANVAKFMTLSDVEGNFNRSAEILNAWSPTNTGSNIPRLSRTDDNGSFTTASDWYLEDASYLRLKNLTVSYDLSRLMRKAGHFAKRGSSLMVYVSGENLFTITNYSGIDPEVGGWDAMKYPVSRTISLGVKLTY